MASDTTAALAGLKRLIFAAGNADRHDDRLNEAEDVLTELLYQRIATNDDLAQSVLECLKSVQAYSVLVEELKHTYQTGMVHAIRAGDFERVTDYIMSLLTGRGLGHRDLYEPFIPLVQIIQAALQERDLPLARDLWNPARTFYEKGERVDGDE